jgi:hypothetical protein
MIEMPSAALAEEIFLGQLFRVARGDVVVRLAGGNPVGLAPLVDLRWRPDTNLSARVGADDAPPGPSRVRDFSDVPRTAERRSLIGVR